MPFPLPGAAAQLALVLTAACTQPGDPAGPAPTAEQAGRGGDGGATQGSSPPAPIAATAGGQPAFGAIRADETIRFVGTEPFWGGTVSAGQLIYTTPENEAGESIAVRRFAGNNGLGFSGTLGGKPLDLTITPGSCSDGMSDRTFPFTATLRIGEEQRNGCAWTDRAPFTGSAKP